jgi:hypothetical protein
MAITKDNLGYILIGVVYFAIFTQIVGVFLVWDEDPNSYLFYNKIYFFVVAFLAIWAHYKCIVTNPGKITHKLNPFVLEFYINLHEIPVKRAERFQQSYGRMFFEKQDGEPEEEIKEEEDDTDYDEFDYEPVTSVTDEVMKKCAREYKIEFKRCDRCYIVRTPRVHHCSVCKGCIMKMDHHCPWINNCVGQFTQKFFIQFCYYCLLGCTNAAYQTLYYFIYKHKAE